MGRGYEAPAFLRIALLVLGWFQLLSAIAGGVGLIAPGSIGMPPEWLEGSVFSSYLWPGIILLVVVGGTQALAVIAQHRRLTVAWGLHAAAGATMVIWIFVELAILLLFSVLHAIYFATGLLQIVLVVLVLGAWPRPFIERMPRP